MRYLPLTPDDRIDMLARIGVADIDELFAAIPADKRLSTELDLPPRKSEMEVQRLLSAMAAKNVAAGSAPFFVGAGALQASHSSQRRSSDPALRIHDQLHALSARDCAGYAAGDFRVPDSGCGADCDGCLQRFDV